tara:strand:- start:2477 stop:3193 length:717 start_codon:yes stop_codon:yes gene_type:complete
LADLGFYNKEIQTIQQQLINRLQTIVPGIKKAKGTELMQLAKTINFFNEMRRLGYDDLIEDVNKAFEREIASIYAELSSRELARLPIASISIVRELKNFELGYLTGTARQYTLQLRNAMLRGIITGQTNRQIISGLSSSFGVGTFISSSEASFLINDAFATFSNTVRANAFQQFPNAKFTYIGPKDEKVRPACKEVLKLVKEKGPMTISEINALRIKGFQGFGRRGGYNCRHDWVRAL